MEDEEDGACEAMSRQVELAERWKPRDKHPRVLGSDRVKSGSALTTRPSQWGGHGTWRISRLADHPFMTLMGLVHASSREARAKTLVPACL